MKKLCVIAAIIFGVFAPASALPASTSITDKDVRIALNDLDVALQRRQQYIKTRQNRIDTLCSRLKASSTLNDSLEYMLAIGEAYTSFNADSAIVYLRRGIDRADGDILTRMTLLYGTQMSLAGLSNRAIEIYESINPDSLPADLQVDYHTGARQMYSYVASSFSDYHVFADSMNVRALESQQKLIGLLPKNTDLYKINLGEYYLLTGQINKARVVLAELLANLPKENNLRARAAHMLHQIASADGDENLSTYYLAQSAISDISSVTLEVLSLQELGTRMYSRGEIERAYLYLTTALANAVECHASARMLESSRALPLIEQSYRHQENLLHRRSYVIIFILIVLLLCVAAALAFVRLEMKRMARLQAHLAEANRLKEVYISRFLSLCSIYMEKLTQFSKMVERKLSTGSTAELLRMTKSGRFIEEQSRDFYEVFDDAFLHICPTFASDVNKLLRPDAQIELQPGTRMNTDLRILAFMRLGVDDAARIGQMLNYSINTIYAYRNRLKARAISRDTFEDDIAAIGS